MTREQLCTRAKSIAKEIARTEGAKDRLYRKRTDLFVKMKAAGMTNAQIAEAAQVSEGMVRKVVNGAR